MATIHLVRHGQASFGASDYDQLSPTGYEQGRRLAAAIRGRLGDTLMVCGGMKRHWQTAEAFLACRPAPMEWETDERWNEFDFIDVIAACRPELKDAASLRAWLSGLADGHRAFQRLYEEAVRRWVGGEHDADYSESRPAFRQRVRQALTALAERLPKDGQAVVFTSGGPIVAIVQDILGIPAERAASLERALVNGSVTTLAVRKSGIFLTTFNAFSHLESENENHVTHR